MTHLIGVVALPSIATLLSSDDRFQVISGEDFRSSARAAGAAARSGGLAGIVVGDDPDGHPSAEAWLGGVASHAPTVVVRLAGGAGINAPGLSALIEPGEAGANVAELLSALGVEAPDLGELVMDLHGKISRRESPAAATEVSTQAFDDLDDLEDWDSPQVSPTSQDDSGDYNPWATPPPAPAPVVEAVAPSAPAQTPAPVADVLEDDFGGDDFDPDDLEDFDFESEQPAQPAPAREPVVTPAPAPVRPEPGATPVPAQEETVIPSPAPAPVTRVEPDPAPVRVAEPDRAAISGSPHDQVAAALGEVDELDILLSRPTAHVPGLQRGVVCIPFAARGGVGKSTETLSLAARAASRGLRVTVIDANRGQGDLRTYLRLGTSGLRTIYDAAVGGSAKDAFLMPHELAALRPGDAQDLGFALVLAPPPGLADPEVVTAEVYASVIEHARTISDLVLIDTQIIESWDTSGLINDVMIPLLQEDAWGVGVSDPSSPGVKNLAERLGHFLSRGVRRERLLLVINKAEPDDIAAMHQVGQILGRQGDFVGVVPVSNEIRLAMNEGRVPSDDPALAPVLDSILLRVTGRQEFQPEPESSSRGGRRGLRSWFSRGGRG